MSAGQVAGYRMQVAGSVRNRSCSHEPFACHSERSEESPFVAQGRLREEFPFVAQGRLREEFQIVGAE